MSKYHLRQRKWRRYIVALFMAVFVVWLLLLANFVYNLPTATNRLPYHSDGIVVLTGGSQRVATGVKLMQFGLAKRMFISGVANDLEIRTALKKLKPEMVACCVELGYEAPDTIGNAKETAKWARSHQINSLILVTANYHMQRSLLEFRRIMPSVIVYPQAVFPDSFPSSNWWKSSRAIGLLLVEYHKFLRSQIMLTLLD